MCGRYTITIPIEELAEELEIPIPDFALPPRYNAAPGQFLPVITSDNPDSIQLFKWGLVPFWAKDPSIGNKMINARGETLSEKPAFRNLLRKKRCLVLADGFFEWKPEGKQKQPFHIFFRGKKLLTFAGLWDSWTDPEGKELQTFTIITVPPNPFMENIHNRMPAILTGENRKKWLREGLSTEELLSMLQPLQGDFLESSEVSKKVNSPVNDFPEILEKP
jgi:putative SOS response-associated peptidase YedK